MQTEHYCNLVRRDRMTNFFESALQLKFEDTDNTSIFIHACESCTLMAGLEKRRGLFCFGSLVVLGVVFRYLSLCLL